MPFRRLPDAPRVIGLTGFGRVGKDTVATILSSQYGYTQVTFATPIYGVVESLNPIIEVSASAGPKFQAQPYRRLSDLVSEYGWHWIKEHAPEGRRLLVAQGDAIRALDATFWVRAALARTERPEARFVFTDCRYLTESAAVQSAGGSLVRITRSGVGPALDPHTGQPYESEMHLADVAVDATIRNDTDGLDALAETVDAVLAALSGPTAAAGTQVPIGSGLAA